MGSATAPRSTALPPETKLHLLARTRPSLAARPAAAVTICCLTTWGTECWAEPTERPEVTVVSARSETTVRIFQRALLPGPNGSLVQADTLVPVLEYWSLGARGVPTPWSAQAAQVEVSGFLDATFGQREHEPPLTGDVTSAWIRQPWGPLTVTLGRQATFGGASRYARFDGATLRLGQTPAPGLWGVTEIYGGYTVLPRWDQRIGYYHLGSAADSLVREPEALPPAERAGNRLYGARGRLHWSRLASAGVSFHEQRRVHDLERRNFGVDATVTPSKELALNADVVFEADSAEVMDAGVWLDVQPQDWWYATASYSHVRPDLYLSRQSVLSVFDTGGFDETGVDLMFFPLSSISASARGFVQWLSDSSLGARGELQLRTDVDRARRTRLGLTYGRVVVPDGGYHLARTSMRQRLLSSLLAVGEAYFYWYDRAISDRRTSSVFAANVAWSWSQQLQILGGASVAQTPYAARDVQALLRLRYETAVYGGGAK